MELAGSAEVTGLLKAWSSGDQAALDRLTALVHGELHRTARRYMRNERPGNTLQATALVNEVDLRLVDVKNVDWQHRAQFFAISAQIMRNILSGYWVQTLWKAQARLMLVCSGYGRRPTSDRSE